MIAGTAYGVALNDREERAALAAAFLEAPYLAPPKAPVVYIKPRSALVGTDGSIVTPGMVRVGPTVALMIGRDATGVAPDQAMAHVTAVRLALDISLPQESYFRPAVAEACRDGFLPLAAPAVMPKSFGPIATHIDGREAHRWSLDRLEVPIAELIATLSGFMTLRAGDLLLVGVPGDAPMASPGQSVAVSSAGLPTLEAQLVEART